MNEKKAINLSGVLVLLVLVGFGAYTIYAQNKNLDKKDTTPDTKEEEKKEEPVEPEPENAYIMIRRDYVENDTNVSILIYSNGEYRKSTNLEDEDNYRIMRVLTEQEMVEINNILSDMYYEEPEKSPNEAYGLKVSFGVNQELNSIEYHKQNSINKLYNLIIKL